VKSCSTTRAGVKAISVLGAACGSQVHPGVPAAQRLDVRARDVDLVLVTEQVLEQDFQAEGQVGYVELLPELLQAVKAVVLSIDRQDGAG
jgi:hypothetical protein